MDPMNRSWYARPWCYVPGNNISRSHKSATAGFPVYASVRVLLHFVHFSLKLMLPNILFTSYIVFRFKFIIQFYLYSVVFDLIYTHWHWHALFSVYAANYWRGVELCDSLHCENVKVTSFSVLFVCSYISSFHLLFEN